MGGISLRAKVYDAIKSGIRTNQELALNLGIHVRQAEHATRTLTELGFICRPKSNIGKRVAEWVPTGKAYQETPRAPSSRPRRIRAKPDPHRVPPERSAMDDLQACMKKWLGSMKPLGEPFASILAKSLTDLYETDSPKPIGVDKAGADD